MWRDGALVEGDGEKYMCESRRVGLEHLLKNCGENGWSVGEGGIYKGRGYYVA